MNLFRTLTIYLKFVRFKDISRHLFVENFRKTLINSFKAKNNEIYLSMYVNSNWVLYITSNLNSIQICHFKISYFISNIIFIRTNFLQIKRTCLLCFLSKSICYILLKFTTFILPINRISQWCYFSNTIQNRIKQYNSKKQVLFFIQHNGYKTQILCHIPHSFSSRFLYCLFGS